MRSWLTGRINPLAACGHDHRCWSRLSDTTVADRPAADSENGRRRGAAELVQATQQLRSLELPLEMPVAHLGKLAVAMRVGVAASAPVIYSGIWQRATVSLEGAPPVFRPINDDDMNLVTSCDRNDPVSMIVADRFRRALDLRLIGPPSRSTLACAQQLVYLARAAAHLQPRAHQRTRRLRRLSIFGFPVRLSRKIE